MAPKKSANLPDEVEEIKKSLDFLSAEIKTVAAQQNKIMELMGEIQSLKIQNIEKDKKITFLENRVADLEQYTRMNDLIISGLKTRHRSYARAAAASEDTAAGRGGADAPEVDRESLEQQIKIKRLSEENTKVMEYARSRSATSVKTASLDPGFAISTPAQLCTSALTFCSTKPRGSMMRRSGENLLLRNISNKLPLWTKRVLKMEDDHLEVIKRDHSAERQN
ncbi:Ubiquinone/menaquinone biosynthesis C-methyltransferase UbiE [Dissostichus eleginoides]|uniref:Ubiquinone/menaquinone biosynthesis C-methyltransferase UbiE n=1 Tax=Dissostichus eleginoides TaxID=100907 RepID=A0AAD9BHY4_DISEL|nr:Ubiquinone/menaquinone biosynthesis C-methyltransferase UbiE [Dissostichus eleginoides]